MTQIDVGLEAVRFRGFDEGVQVRARRDAGDRVTEQPVFCD